MTHRRGEGQAQQTIAKLRASRIPVSDSRTGRSELAADVVFAIGLGDPKATIRRVCGDKVADRMKRIGKFGMDEEGEINGPWRHSGVQGLWYVVGGLALSGFHSNHVELQFKAMEGASSGMSVNSKGKRWVCKSLYQMMKTPRNTVTTS